MMLDTQASFLQMKNFCSEKKKKRLLATLTLNTQHCINHQVI